jgi:hypothetical protein
MNTNNPSPLLNAALFLQEKTTVISSMSDCFETIRKIV